MNEAVLFCERILKSLRNNFKEFLFKRKQILEKVDVFLLTAFHFFLSYVSVILILLYFFFSLHLFSFLCVCTHTLMHMNAVPMEPEEGVTSSGSRVTGGYELPDLVAENRTWFLYKSSKCS